MALAIVPVGQTRALPSEISQVVIESNVRRHRIGFIELASSVTHVWYVKGRPSKIALILDIFAQNAKTNAAKTQVEIAQLQYLLPRLTKAWTHFQRQKGGGVKKKGVKKKGGEDWAF